MKHNRKLAYAISVALGACVSARAAYAQQQPAADTTAAATPSEGLQEVTVTATRRAQSVQDVPLTIQAIAGEQLQQLNVTNEYDLFKYTPNVTYSGNGPGTGNIFMRGLGGIGSGNQSQSTTAAFPNVALYLDEQSMQFPARNVDVYVIDMQRIEVLEGPQGTLFGGGAQAGAIRYITNKPDLNNFSGELNAGYGITANGGDPNNNANAVLNVPIIPGVFALRAVVFDDHHGGYIDNVPGTISYFPGTAAATTGATANNGNLVANNTNPVDYGGARLEALWKINDSWNLLLEQNYQDMDAQGYFYAYPAASDGTPLQPYQIEAFTPAFNKDRYESTAWTLNGELPDLSIVYTGSYMVRHIDGQQDYSNYLRSSSGSYYGCIGTGAAYFNPGNNFPQLTGHKLQCAAPVGDWNDNVQNQHISHELRLSTPTDWRVRDLFGVYWEKFNIDDQMNFNYLPLPQCTTANYDAYLAGGPDCLSAVGPVPGAFATDPGLRVGTNTAFGEDAQRGYKQTALFDSVDFDIIPKVLTLTAGTRWYSYEEYEEGSEFYTESDTGGLVVDHPNGACTLAGGCGFPINLHKGEHGFRSRANLTYHITPDVMAYYTWSQGFRPGGFNRTNSTPEAIHLAAEVPYCTYPGGVKTCIPDSDQYEKPSGYTSDQLTNNEVGLKTELFDHHLMLNLSAYYMQWSNVQLSLFEPTVLGNTTFNVNGPSFDIKGFEVQFDALLFAGFSIQGSSSVNSASQSNSPCLESVGANTGNAKNANNPTPAGECVVVNSPVGPVPNTLGAFGTAPAFSPPWMFNIRARYDWTMGGGGYKPFIWIGASHISSMTNEPRNFFSGSNPTYANPPVTTLLLYTIPGYTTYDGAIGVVKDQWTAQLSGQNLTDDYGPTNISSGQFIKSEVPLRPRVLTFSIGYKF
ncbi:MAG TPA: TonB-dependent receptor [Steroidobacteraceae bacterium]|nr:TonB-dependent receptor [Steroidobacteraceae bacterium]